MEKLCGFVILLCVSNVKFICGYSYLSERWLKHIIVGVIAFTQVFRRLQKLIDTEDSNLRANRASNTDRNHTIIAMTGQLRDSDKKQLEQWIGQGQKQFTLLFSATKDGCTTQKFHEKCDYQGSTVTVVYNEPGSVYGGYTSASWAASIGATRDDKAFLFQLKFSNNDTFRKFPITNVAYSIYSNASYGPMFGGNSGYDMNLFSGTINSSGGFFQLNGGYTFGTNYTMSGVTNWNDIHNGNLKVKDIEVYSVAAKYIEPITAAPTLQPWIEMPEWNTQLAQELVQQVKSIKPSKSASDKLQLQYHRILLIGPVGSGKSSFCNTVNNVFKERLTQIAISGEGTTSITTTYEPYVIKTTGDNAKLHMRLCDTRGLDPKSGIDTMEFNFLLSGHIPDKYEFNAEKSIALDDPLFVMKPTMTEKPHCVVFVFDATTLQKLDSKLVEKIKSFRIVATRKQIPQAVLLTKIDLQDKALGQNLEKVYSSTVIEKTVNDVYEMFGFPRNTVFPVKNYEKERMLNNGVNILALTALVQILYFAEDYIDKELSESVKKTNEPKKLTVEDRSESE